jgi:hypothetical protein
MHRKIIGTSMALLVTSGWLALGATSASASVSVPAPSCGSYSGKIFCSGNQGTTITYTWTQTITSDGVSYTSSFPATHINGNCEHNTRYTFSYTYVSGGVTYASGATSLACVTSPPE